VTGLVNELWQRLDVIIRGYHGYIDKHMSGAVMALWGTQQASEDDPEQAVRAALEMQAAMVAFRQEYKVDFAMRIGINTGPVLLGEVGSTHEFTALGDTVNTASRLQDAASLGSVLIPMIFTATCRRIQRAGVRAAAGQRQERTCGPIRCCLPACVFAWEGAAWRMRHAWDASRVGAASAGA
jgi:class 3 adenylate cyclase